MTHDDSEALTEAGSSATAPRIAVITVAYRSESVLPAFLDSIHESTAGSPLVLVADNLPAQGESTRILVQQRGHLYLPLPENPGYGGAINAAARELPASVAWILVSNPDVILGRDTLDLLVKIGDHDSSIAAVGPRVEERDGSVYPSARAVPSLRNGIGHALFANIWTTNPWTRAYRSDGLYTDASRDAGWLSGSCVLVRRDVFDELGGFDEGYFMYFEDVDLGYRIGLSGLRNIYAPQVAITHIGAHSTQGESAAMIEAHHASARRFLSKKYGSAWMWPIRASLIVGLMVRSRALRRRGHT